jgi:hypothetical protein
MTAVPSPMAALAPAGPVPATPTEVGVGIIAGSGPPVPRPAGDKAQQQAEAGQRGVDRSNHGKVSRDWRRNGRRPARFAWHVVRKSVFYP